MTSKRHVRRRSCTGKRAYPTEAEAQAAARRIEQRDGRPVEAYRCRLCGKGFHVGHRPHWLRQAIAARRRG
jgi:hypothetical protein